MWAWWLCLGLLIGLLVGLIVGAVGAFACVAGRRAGQSAWGFVKAKKQKVK